MGKGLRRPKNKEELDGREAAGLWKAIALAKDIGERKEKITLAVILRIHKIFLGDVYPEFAGSFRKSGQDIKKLKCIEPPPGRLVQEKMYEFWRELDRRISILSFRPKNQNRTQRKKRTNNILEIAAWIQYQLTAIHPFCEGNGRMARLMTNLILYRYGLQPSHLKYEGENKEKYLSALCQIDHYRDYEPLKKIIAEGIYETYRKVFEAKSGT